MNLDFSLIVIVMLCLICISQVFLIADSSQKNSSINFLSIYKNFLAKNYAGHEGEKVNYFSRNNLRFWKREYYKKHFAGCLLDGTSFFI